MNSNHMPFKKNQFFPSFTIIELLIVIVIIGILATIVFVSYSGIQVKAHDASIQSDVSNMDKAQKVYKASTDNPGKAYYSGNESEATYDSDLGFRPSNGNVIDVTVNSTDYCIRAYNVKSTYNSLANAYTMGSSDTACTDISPSTEATNDDTAGSSSGDGVSPVIALGGTGDDVGRSLVQTTDGGYVVTGSTNSNGAGGYDIFLAKYTAGGELDWSKTWGGTGTDYGNSIIQTADGGYAVTGNTTILREENPMHLTGLDDNNVTWGDTNDNSDISLVRTADGSYPVAGETTNYEVDNNNTLLAEYASNNDLAVASEHVDMFLVKFTASGELDWDKTWGGDSYDSGSSLVQTADGGYAVTGSTESFGDGYSDMFLAKYTASGELTWSYTWGGYDYDYGNSLVQTTDGGYVVTGSTSSFTGKYDIFLAKYDSDGYIEWDKTWGGALGTYGRSIVQTADGGYAVTGQSFNFDGDGDMFLAKYTTSGEFDWSKTWGGDYYDDGNSLIQTADGGYAVVGNTNSYGQYGGSDMFLAKYTAGGDLAWNKTWGGRDWDAGYSLVQTTNGGYVVTGETNGYGAGGYDIFLARFLSDGTIEYCDEWMCQSPTVNPNSLSFDTADGGVYNYNMSTLVVKTSPTVSSYSQTVTETQIVKLPLIFTNQELYVAYPGEDQTVCKQWTATEGHTIAGFYVSHETESENDIFTVSFNDGTNVNYVYDYSGYYPDPYYVDISGSLATNLEACIQTNSTIQDGYGGEVSGVIYD